MQRPCMSQLPATLVAALLHLRRLDLCANHDLIIGTRLTALSSLRELSLVSYDVVVKPGATLPPSLTKIYLSNALCLPPPVAALPNLRHLLLEEMEEGVLGQLSLLAGCLEHLELRRCYSLPPAEAPGALTRLQSFHLWDPPRPFDFWHLPPDETSITGADVAAVLAALPPSLTALTLTLGDIGDDALAILAPIAALSWLQRLRLAGDLPHSLALPPESGWWAGLRILALPASVAAADAAALTAGALQLEALILFGFCGSEVPHSSVVLQAAERLPRLRHMCVESLKSLDSRGKHPDRECFVHLLSQLARDRALFQPCSKRDSLVLACL
ncbi:hypothetical protein ABPG75_004584 [Micractinium tetrahymenae]